MHYKSLFGSLSKFSFRIHLRLHLLDTCSWMELICLDNFFIQFFKIGSPHNNWFLQTNRTEELQFFHWFWTMATIPQFIIIHAFQVIENPTCVYNKCTFLFAFLTSFLYCKCDILPFIVLGSFFITFLKFILLLLTALYIIYNKYQNSNKNPNKSANQD